MSNKKRTNIYIYIPYKSCVLMISVVVGEGGLNVWISLLLHGLTARLLWHGILHDVYCINVQYSCPVNKILNISSERSVACFLPVGAASHKKQPTSVNWKDCSNYEPHIMSSHYLFQY